MKEKVCEVFEKCGGCKYLDKTYKETLDIKTTYVKELVKKELKNNIKVKDTYGMESPYNYRNKGKYVFKTNRTSEVKMGFYEEGTHKVIENNKCAIQNNKINEVAQYIYELIKKYKISIYNEDTRKGFLRHLVIRYGVHTNELMIIFVTTDSKMYKRNEIINEIVTKYHNVKTIVQNINTKENNAVLGNKNIKLYGSGFIVDTLKDLKFKISPSSFYQVNPIQTVNLYDIAINEANITKNDTVFDLYSGIGTISLFVSKKAKKVYGIEIVKEAVKDAIENAKLNHITNANFYAGKVENVLPRLIQRENRADVVFVDPPRSGLDKITIDTLMKLQPKKIVYISCNPDTLVENLKTLRNKYNIEAIQPVDMFPFTAHVECVAVLHSK